jgi:transcription elongation factor GreB
MSKAFTRENDTEEDEPPPLRNTLPRRARNYVTAEGAQRWQAELKRLAEQERPVLMAAKENHGGEDAARLLRRLDARVRELTERLESAEVMPVPVPPPAEVQFGATVKVRDDLGHEAEYRIVGVDEADYERGWVSWASPMARTLLQAMPGDRVPLSTPAGERMLEVLSVRY